MRSKAVLVTLALFFLAPLFATTARAAEHSISQDSACKRKRAKKSDSEGKDTKKKDKDGKKPYGFEL